MCGIVAYIGPKEAYPIIIKGLRRLEYRGYDSAGVALLNGDLHTYKCKGKVQDLVDHANQYNLEGTIGIGHTRWATHGIPSEKNAHPHQSNENRLAIVHNGIIENYDSIKSALIEKGHIFESDTDTEVLIHLIDEIQQKENISLEEAVRIAMKKVEGAFAIVIIEKNNPHRLVAAKRGSPLVIGIGKGKNEHFLCSDHHSIGEFTNDFIILKDDEVAVVERDKEIILRNSDNTIQSPFIQKLDTQIENIEKGDYDAFMIKEIMEQPETIRDCMRGRLNAEQGWIRLGGLELNADRIINANRIIFAGCGTSWHAGLIAEYIIEELARIPVEVEYASEMRYRNPIITEKDIVIGLSQSGETADTLSALKLAKEKNAFLYGIVNVVGSAIARLTNAGSYIHAGVEIGVASTKAFTGQVTLLTMFALSLAEKRGTISKTDFSKYLKGLEEIPEKVEQVLKNAAKIEYIASEITQNNALYLGRGVNFPIALEGALKLKEISYIHAEGYPAAEMKHGPIALIDANMPVFVIATNKSTYEKIASNIQTVKSRNGKIIAIVTEGDNYISKMADFVIEIPDTEEFLTPLLSIIPLQLLSYFIARNRGKNVDQPRNLAKSVTVE